MSEAALIKLEAERSQIKREVDARKRAVPVKEACEA
jgi:hypothetical protein